MGILLLKTLKNRVIFLTNRSDLAVESYEAEEKTELSGVKVTQNENVTTVSVLNETGARKLGKPVGKYVTYSAEQFADEVNMFDGRLNDLAGILSSLLPKNTASVLVAGLGNTDITADALGPKTLDYVLATRHILNCDGEENEFFKNFFSVAAISTGVLGDTGIESAEIIKGVVNQIKPDCVIAVDALAATSAQRLGSTVQLSDSGISPGSGVGNHRHEISRRTLGVPVISVGIPTVVSTSVICGREDSGGMFVTPREIDRLIEQGAKLIGMTINVCLQKNIEPKDLFSLVG